MGIPAEAGYGEIRCTPGHPFYVEDEGFVHAENLTAGSLLVTPEGKYVKVESVETDETVTADTPVMVYNFEVEDWHTYYVGEWCVLVHNSCDMVDGHMVGENGTQTYSNTLWEGKQGRIDVENPKPGSRAGQIHFQDWEGNKYIYNIEENKFYLFDNKDILAPKRIQKLLDDPSFLNAIKKGLKYLGEVFKGKK